VRSVRPEALLALNPKSPKEDEVWAALTPDDLTEVTLPLSKLRRTPRNG
jgi:hypothetical protein